MNRLAQAVQEAGGVTAPLDRSARLRELLEAELERGEQELGKPRSGYGDPLAVAFGAGPKGLLAACPVPISLRADAAAVGERSWFVTAAAVGALVEAVGADAPRGASDLALQAGELDGKLVLRLGPGDPELAALAFDDRVDGADRLRAGGAAIPAHVLEGAGDFKPPIGSAHPLRVAEAVARLGGEPTDAASVDGLEEAVFSLLELPEQVARAHEDPNRVRRVARRILQRLDGMGKWGGYHTEFEHLARSFAPGNERRLAAEVGERLVSAGLLVEKLSVGQRHVFLNPRRSGDIHALIERGQLPAGLTLPDG